MPPKEKAANSGVAAESQQNASSDGIYNYELPRSLVAKIARASVRGSNFRCIMGDKHTQVPDNCKFQKETILALLKGSTVFINCLGTYKSVPPRKIPQLDHHRSRRVSPQSRPVFAFSEPDLVLMK